MFCTVCGNEISRGQCFCGNCGFKCPPSRGHFPKFQEEKEVPTFKDFMEKRNREAEDVSKEKASERRERFVPKKKKKGADLVKVSMFSSMHLYCQ